MNDVVQLLDKDWISIVLLTNISYLISIFKEHLSISHEIHCHQESY